MRTQLPLKGAEPPLFALCLLWPNGWMEEDATWYKVDLGPGQTVLDGDPAPPMQMGTAAPPPFSSVCEQFLNGTSAHYRLFSARNGG